MRRGRLVTRPYLSTMSINHRIFPVLLDKKIEVCHCKELARGPKGGVCSKCSKAILSDEEEREV